jgi:hypothetical protein
MVLTSSGWARSFVGDPALAHRRTAGDPRRKLGRDRVPVEPGIGNVEVEPPLALADGPARDRVGEHGRQ